MLNPPAGEDPVDCPAVVGGNVETSQRIVDVLLGALQMAAASQGTMNNLTFGDGTFGFGAIELDTAVRYGLPITVIIGNDARWNAEYQLQIKNYGADRTIGCELLPSRYDKIVEALGGHGEFVSDLDELAPAIDRALASELPACINVEIEGAAAPTFR